MGGSMTDTTQAVDRYIPSMSRPSSHQGRLMAAAMLLSIGCPMSMNRVASRAEGTLAPEMVIQKTIVSISSIIGNPHIRLVTSRSMVWSRSKRELLSGRVTALSASQAASV